MGCADDCYITSKQLYLGRLSMYEWVMEQLPVQVDDNDLDVFQYFGGDTCWGIYRTDRPADQLGSTSHFTETVNAKFQFNFTGTSVAVYGTVTANAITKNTTTSFSIDSSPPVTHITSGQSSPTFRQLLFKSPDLTLGFHTLTASLVSDSGWFSVDYVEYIPLDQHHSSFSSRVAGPASNTSASNSHISIGTVTGIVIGMVIILLGIIFLVLHLYRRRKNRIKNPNRTLDPLVIPFPSPPIRQPKHTPPLSDNANVQRAHKLVNSLSPDHADLHLQPTRNPRAFYHQHSDSFSSANQSTASDIPLLQYPIPVKSRTDIDHRINETG